jgi:hypothetical protein
MRALTIAECRSWIGALDFEEIQDEVVLPKEIVHSQDAWIDQHSRKIALVAKAIVELLNKSSDVLLWITENGVWPTEENNALFKKLLSAYGETRPHWEAPGYLFEPHEAEELQGFLRLALIFGWGGNVVSGNPRVAFIFSHAEFVRITTPDHRLYESWLQSVPCFEVAK